MQYVRDIPLIADRIEDKARQCRSELQRCIDYPHLMEFEWAENRLAEFNLWSATTGVFAGEKASLDARLAVDWDTKNLVISILLLLQACLKKCQNASNNSTSESGDEEEEEEEDSSQLRTPEEIPRGFSPWSDQTSDSDSDDAEVAEQTTSSLQDAKAEVGQVIDHLTRLAVAIRKSGSNSRAQKADKLFKPEQHQRLRHHLNVLLLARGSVEGRTSYEVESQSLTVVQERLILANLRRRNRYLYAHRHAKKLASEHTDPRKAFMSPPKVTEADFAYITSEDLVEGPDEPVRKEIVGDDVNVDDEVQTQQPEPSVLTRTTHSAVDQPIEAVLPQATTPSQAAKTNITATAAKIEYPRPPKPKNDVRLFQCPCCAQTLPEMFRGNTLWKKHLMADICPYTCIVEDCPKPERLYATRREWTKHVQNEHQQTCWQCPACNKPEMAPLVFPTAESFTKHLTEVHGDSINVAQHSTIIEEAARPVPAGISSCPLCDSTGTADSDELLDHIAEHLHSFALRSLPWARDDGNDHSDGEGPSDDSGEPPHNDLYDNYFDDGNYFAQASEEGTESKQDNVFTDSERDSEGLASLPSNVSWENTPLITDDQVSSLSDDSDYRISQQPLAMTAALRNSYGPEVLFPEELVAQPMPQLQLDPDRYIERRTREVMKGLLLPDRERRRFRDKFACMDGSNYTRKIHINGVAYDLTAVEDRNKGGMLVTVYPRRSFRVNRTDPGGTTLHSYMGAEVEYTVVRDTATDFTLAEAIPILHTQSHSTANPQTPTYIQSQYSQDQLQSSNPMPEATEEPKRGVRKIWNRLRGKKANEASTHDYPEGLAVHAQNGKLLGPSERLLLGAWLSMLASLVHDSREASENPIDHLHKQALEEIFSARIDPRNHDWPRIERRKVIEIGDVSALSTYDRARSDFDHIGLPSYKGASLAELIMARNLALRQHNDTALTEIRRYAGERGYTDLVEQLDYEIDGFEDTSPSILDVLVAREIALEMKSVEDLTEIRRWAVEVNKPDWISRLDNDIDRVEDMD